MKRISAALLALIMILCLTACGGKGEDVTGMYLCVGEAYDDGALGEPAGECWLELKNGGKGTYYADVAFDLAWKVDGETFDGTISFWGVEDKMAGTIKDGVVDVKCADKAMRFVKEGVKAPSDIGGGDSGSVERNSGEEVANSMFDFDSVTVASSVKDALAVETSDEENSESGFVSPTTAIKLGSKWYGIMELTDFKGADTEDYSKEIVAEIDKTAQGYERLDIFAGSDSETGTRVLSVYILLSDDRIDADISFPDEELLAQSQAYTEFIADNTEYQVKVELSTDIAVTNFCVLSLNIDSVTDEGTMVFSENEMYSLETLTPEKPLVVGIAFAGDIPNMGISYVDANGAERVYAIALSGEDGRPLLVKAELTR